MQHFTRRKMLKFATFAGSSLVMNSFTKELAPAPQMLTRPIPSTGEQLPVVGLGTWQQFDVSSLTDYESLTEVLKLLHDNGGQVIDSSPMYGRAEEVVGDLTARVKLAEEFFYATKVWTNGEQNGISQMQQSMRKMRRRKMDLMQIHNLVDWRTHMKTLRAWKDLGTIRYIGITHYTRSAHQELEKIIKSEPVDFVQVNYSITETNAEKSLFDTCVDKKVALIINQPFESGALFSAVKGKALSSWVSDFDIHSWGQYFLKFILSHTAVTCVIPGTSNPKHLLDNVRAGYGRLPDIAARKKMYEYINSL